MTYTKKFFQERRAKTQASSSLILDSFWEAFHPETVLDVGCATGIWLSEAKKRGARSIKGIDGPWVPRQQLEIDEEALVEHDFTETFPRDIGKYDAAFCIELAEHLSPELGDDLIRFLTTHADVILFSAAVPGQGGTGHVNEQLQSYWFEKFQQQGFECLDIIRPGIWDNPGINVIYKQNMLVYVRSSDTGHEISPLLRPAHIREKDSFRLDRIHPELFRMRSEARAPGFFQRVKRKIRSLS